jgi:hypothetical protein
MEREGEGEREGTAGEAGNTSEDPFVGGGGLRQLLELIRAVGHWRGTGEECD